MSDVKKHWIAALAYVTSIYATLGVVPAPLAYLRSHNLLRFTIALLFAACLAYLLKVMHSRTRNPWRFFGLLVLAGVYATVVTMVRRPEEKIHFIQYGLVGALFARALRHHLPRPIAAYGVALAIASVAGWLDEMLQGLLPNRHYDVSDIYLDAASAFLGLLVYALIPHRRIADAPMPRHLT